MYTSLAIAGDRQLHLYHIINCQKPVCSSHFVRSVRHLVTVCLERSVHEKHMAGRWLPDLLMEESAQQNVPGLNACNGIGGLACCSLSARSDSSFPNLKAVHPPKTDTQLTLEVLGLLYHACPLSLLGGYHMLGIWGTCCLFRGALCGLYFDLTEKK